jgi:hypothetical protein
METTSNVCTLCQRDTPTAFVEEHHLIPKSKGGKKKDTILVCCDCGNIVHKLFTLNELRDEFYTVESLLANERMQKWIKWVRKRPDKFHINMSSKKSKR